VSRRRGDRPLDPHEQAAWDAVARTVKPIRKPRIAASPAKEAVQRAASAPPRSVPHMAPLDAAAIKPGLLLTRGRFQPAPTPSAADANRDRLDGGWDRRISSGTLIPDATIDLHGHTLSTAHARLMRAIEQALAQDARVLLVIAGKAREHNALMGDRPRGAIRAQLRHWLDASPLAHRIAAVRGAHPRHGGAGALYIVLRRSKNA